VLGKVHVGHQCRKSYNSISLCNLSGFLIESRVRALADRNKMLQVGTFETPLTLYRHKPSAAEKQARPKRGQEDWSLPVILVVAKGSYDAV
jgi:hypothetical protein